MGLMLSSLGALEVAIMTTADAARDDKFGIKMTPYINDWLHYKCIYKMEMFLSSLKVNLKNL